MEENVPVAEEQAAICTIDKLTYSEGRAYRYHISDQDGNLLYVAEPTGLLFPSPKRLIEFFDPDHNLVARLQPPDIPPWLRATRYELLTAAEAEESIAVIRERWRLVDILLLRLPYYEVETGAKRYIAKGSRYGENLYEVFVAPEEEPEESAPPPPNEQEIERLLNPPSVPDEAIEESTGEAEESAWETAEWPVEEEPGIESESGATKIAQIRCPVVGPSYIIENVAEPLRQAVLVLAALTILIDVELYT